MTRPAPGSREAEDPWRQRLHELADTLVPDVLARPATLGATRLVCVDGPAGSGKSTLARAVHEAAARVAATELVQLDDLLDGWDGLAQVSENLRRDVLAPLGENRPGRYRRYDWHRGRFAEEHTVEPVDLLVVEGVGSGASSYDSWITRLVWVEAPEALRLARGIARDGEALRPQWLRWMRAEQELFARERTRERADVLVDGS